MAIALKVIFRPPVPTVAAISSPSYKTSSGSFHRSSISEVSFPSSSCSFRSSPSAFRNCTPTAKTSFLPSPILPGRCRGLHFIFAMALNMKMKFGNGNSENTSVADSRATRSALDTPSLEGASKTSSLGKNIVVFCDGTWASNHDDDIKNDSNVLKLYNEMADNSSLKPGDQEQVCQYFTGLGTATINLKEGNNPLEVWVSNLISGAVADDLNDKVAEAYTFIAENYEPGDRIWMFGWSRGAYTIRCISGMIENCGIVLRKVGSRVGEKGSIAKEVIDIALEIYRSRQEHDKTMGEYAINFRSIFSHPHQDVPAIEFLGLWDTVGAYGLPRYSLGEGTTYGVEFHNQYMAASIRRAAQALAVHEWFTNFEPCHILRPPHSPESVSVVETWFPGYHGDVGKGNAALRWIIRHLDSDHGRLRLKRELQEYENQNTPFPIQKLKLSEPALGDNMGLLMGLLQKMWIVKKIPYLLQRPRRIPIYCNPENVSELNGEILFEKGDWEPVFGQRSTLKHNYRSTTYEVLRSTMDSVGLHMPRGVKYDLVTDNNYKLPADGKEKVHPLGSLSEAI